MCDIIRSGEMLARHAGMRLPRNQQQPVTSLDAGRGVLERERSRGDRGNAAVGSSEARI